MENKRNYTQAEAQKLRDALKRVLNAYTALKRVLNAYTYVRFNDDRFRLEQAIDAAGNVMREIEDTKQAPRYSVHEVSTTDAGTIGYSIYDSRSGRVLYEVYAFDTAAEAQAECDRLNGQEGQS